MERFTFRSYASASVFSLIPVTFVAIAVIFRRDIRYFLHQEFLPLISNVSGYFSQQVRRKQKGSHKNNTATEENSSASSPIKSDTKRRLLLLYGTSTGTAKTFAEKLMKSIGARKRQQTFHVSIKNMSEYNFEDNLDKEDIVLVLCSTWEGGVPPESARAFYEWLRDINFDFRVNKDFLSRLNFGVFGLGAAIYGKNFGKAAIEIYEYFSNLGASPITALVLGDDATNLEECFIEWCDEITTYIAAIDPLYASKQEEAEAEKALARQKKNMTNDRYRKFINKSSKKSSQSSSECCGGKEGGGEGATTCVHHSTDSATTTAPASKIDSNLLPPPVEEEPELEEEDVINNGFVTMDNNGGDAHSACGDGEEGDDGQEELGHSHSGVVDLEDLGSTMTAQAKAALAAQLKGSQHGSSREMVTKLQRKALVKEGYRIIGTHSAVKLCRWTKNQMRGRGGCYKHSFYGITSYQCMEATPSLACANKCVFCWRHHKNPVGTEWRWREDDPAFIVEEAISLHRGMINEMKGVPGVQPSRLQEAYTVRHCALSLVGEPIMYPHINQMLKELHDRRISSFLVTNAQFPDRIAQLDPVTQLYVSVDASTRESLKAIDRPLFKDFWERFLSCLRLMREKKQRTVYRMTLVKAYNMDDQEELEGYVELIEMGQPDFIEIKAVTYCGKSDASSLTMQNVPWHKEVCVYAEQVCALINSRKIINYRYSIATEHEHSCCILIAREDKFKPNGVWHTWIDYDKFDQLINRYYHSRSGDSSEHGNAGKDFTFTSEDYMCITPEWALYKSLEKGFDPQDNRWRRKQQQQLLGSVNGGDTANEGGGNTQAGEEEEPYEATESGCG